MECKKCGATLVDEAVFCNACGTRVDGKKLCENCNNWNDENNAFCNFCGTRIDGKQACIVCGAIVEGAFCPHCGNKMGKEESLPKSNVVQKKEKKNDNSFLNKLFHHIVCSMFIEDNTFFAYTKITDYLYYINIFNVFAQIFTILLVVCSVLAIKANVQGAVGGKNSSVVWSVLSFAFAVSSLIFNILAFNKLKGLIDLTEMIELKGAFAVSIVAVVFAVLLMIISIVEKVFEKKAGE